MEKLKFIFISSQVTTVRCNIIDREKLIYYFQWQICRTDCCSEYLKRARVVKFIAFHLVIDKSIIKFERNYYAWVF